MFDVISVYLILLSSHQSINHGSLASGLGNNSNNMRQAKK